MIYYSQHYSKIFIGIDAGNSDIVKKQFNGIAML